jgi:zinc protease
MRPVPCLIAVLISTLLNTSPSWAKTHTKPTPSTHLSQTAPLAGMTEYRLPNGLKIVLVPDLGKPTTTVNITYQVGSRHEHYGETGMAHLLEHLLFKGTPLIPNLPQELSARGMTVPITLKASPPLTQN